ncbi:MAG: hypothetical protein ACLQRH_16565 [Acidimicrobiales bacterium]
MTSPSDNGDALASSNDPPGPGELKIKERRSWKTWQLLTAVLVAALVGMWINGDTGGSATSASSSTSGTLPPASGSSAAGSTTTTAAGGGSVTTTTAAGGSTSTIAAGGSTTTTAAGGATTTTAAGGSTTTTAAGGSTPPAGPARVLLESPQQQGNWTSTSFTTTVAPWNIGWAFQCAPAPAAGPSFQVSVTPAGAAPSGTPAISETGASGQSVTTQSSLGAQTLVVQAPAGCTWIVKVTGS